jgi:hypothetical protein
VVGCVHLVMQRPGVILKLLSNKKPIIERKKMPDRSIGQIDASLSFSYLNRYPSFFANLSRPLFMVDSGINLSHHLFVVLII